MVVRKVVTYSVGDWSTNAASILKWTRRESNQLRECRMQRGAANKIREILSIDAHLPSHAKMMPCGTITACEINWHRSAHSSSQQRLFSTYNIVMYNKNILKITIRIY